MNKLKGFFFWLLKTLWATGTILVSENDGSHVSHVFLISAQLDPLHPSGDGAEDNVFQLKSTQSHSKAWYRPADCYSECDHLPHLGTKSTQGAVLAAQDECSTKSQEVHSRSRTEMTGWWIHRTFPLATKVWVPREASTVVSSDWRKLLFQAKPHQADAVSK